MLNKLDDDVVAGMLRANTLASVVVSVLLLAGLLAGTAGAKAATPSGEITYSVADGVVTIQTENMTVKISTAMPAAIVWSAGNESEPGYGFLFSAILGFNTTEPTGLVLDEVPYHASFDHAVWSLTGPTEQTDADKGDSVTVALESTVDIIQRLVFGDGNPTPGSPGTVTIEDWATVTVTFIVSTKNHSATFDAVTDSPAFAVNGTSEIKFDISIDILKPIFADSLALDIALMKMNAEDFGPALLSEPYLLRGYQDGTVTESDPAVNETDGETLLMHTFQNRDQFKQLFTFVDVNETSFFGWASEALLDWSNADPALEQVTTYYRTDGEALRMYITTPLTNETELITHDPSIGIFIPSGSGGGIVPLPGGGSIVGSSAMSIAVGLLIGVAVAGGAGAYMATKDLSKEDPTQLVVLEKNRYYRKKN